MSSVFLLSLGCDKNLTDSEKLLYNLSEAGLDLTDDPQDADYAVVNTCCFTEDAKKESIQGIMELSEIKQQGKLKEIIVAGCMAERYMDSLSDMMPEADHIIPLSSFYDIPGLISGENGGVERTGNALKKGGYSRLGADLSFLTGASARGITGTGALARVITTGGVYDYLKIADGCDRNCSYCAIPMIRGHYHSVPEEQLLAEARGMALRGIKELILVAQETTLYGADIYGRKSLPELLKKLCDIRELEHIRLLYAYPESVDKDLIAVMRDEPKILKYLDLPVQHASDRILKAMGRHTDRAGIHDVIAHLRDEMPGIAVRTSLITGFPGEKEEDHEILMDFVEKERFDRLGVFIYSREEGTKAYSMPDQVHWKTKQRRRREIMELQQDIAFSSAEKMKGLRVRVIVDGFLPGEDVYACRTYRDAPDVDGMVFLKSDRELLSGITVDCIVTGSAGYDLEAELITED